MAAAWSWRLLLIVAASGVGIWLLGYFSDVTVPIAVALLITALVVPAVDFLDRHKFPRSLAAGIVLIGLLVTVSSLLALVGQQMATQLTDLRVAVIDGITEIQVWARTGPLGISDAQLTSYIDSARATITESDAAIVGQVGSIGLGLTQFVAGFFIALFAVFFFLYEGDRMWAWTVRLFPRDSRPRVNSSGYTAWKSLTSFVRATVVVALTDAVGIAFSAWALGVPLTLAIGVLVFFGAFVPIIGALLSGFVAVLVALVAQGPWTALFMLLAVIAVQQIESQVLQPFVMGALVSVHPLVIILAIVAGITVAGIFGALIAVPLAACLNGVVKHLAEDRGPPPAPPPVDSPPEPSRGPSPEPA